MVDLAPFRDLYPFASHFLDLPAGRLHYLDEGERNRRPLLMLHGNPTWSFYYRELVRAFRGDYRVIVPDHLGCGLSDKPQDFAYTLEARIEHVSALVKHLDLHEVTMVVHDWGGAIGMGWALRDVQRVQRLVVLNTAAFPATRIPFSINLCRVPGFGALAIRGLNAFAKVALIRAVHHRERLTEQIRAGYLAPYDDWGARVANLRFVQDIPMSRAHPTWATLQHIGESLPRLAGLPMLIVWGGKDFCFDDWFYEEWRRRFPAAEAHYVADAGHYVVEDAYERIIPLMEAFIARP